MRRRDFLTVAGGALVWGRPGAREVRRSTAAETARPPVASPAPAVAPAQPAEEATTTRSGAINVASSNFRMCDEDGTILGSLVGEGGQVVGIRMRADVANEMTRNMLRTARAVSTC